MESSDDELIAAFLSGDISAFDSLFDRHVRRLLGFLRSLGADHDEAEDVAQNTWLRALQAFPSYAARDKFRPWLFQIAWRLWADQRRSAWERGRRELEEDAYLALEDPVPSPQEQMEQDESKLMVEAAIGQLPGQMREVLLLRIDGELTFREIAETLSAPLGTVLWRAREAERRLKFALNARGRGSVKL